MRKSMANAIKNAKLLPIRLIIGGLLVGIVSGFIVMLYRLVLQYAEHILQFIIEFISGSVIKALGWIAILVVIAVIVAKIIKFEPMISGSGIPQIEGEMTGKLNQTWYKVLPAKFIGGFLCLLSGLSLGREGPSIQLGAMSGKGLSKLLSLSKTDEKYMLTCGASAGLAAAFNAPLAGVLFSLEEIHKNFSVSVLISVMTASVTSDYLASKILGNEPVFNFSITQDLPMKYYGLILVLGVILGFFGVFYNWFTLKMQSLYQQCKFLNPTTKIIVPFFVAGILAFTMPVLLGSGGNLIEMMTTTKLSIMVAILLLIGKFIYSGISFGSGAPGGIFFPMLVLGGFAGGIFAMICINIFGLPSEYLNNFVLLAMAGFFTAIVRAPLTGIILIFEMTGSLSQLTSLLLISVSSYIVATLLKCEPIYESLLARILKRQGQNIDNKEKVLKEYVIMHNSPIDGMKISEIDLPSDVLIVAIHRGSEEILPNGDTKLCASDILLVMSNENGDIYDSLNNLCAENSIY